MFASTVRIRRGNQDADRCRPHDDETAAAATKIQAHFRGRRSRQSQKRSSDDSLGKAQEKGDDSEPLRQDSSWRVKPSPSKASVQTAAQIKELRTVKREQPTTFPRRVQDLRIEAWLLFEEPRSSWAAQIVSVVVLLCIVVSILSLVLETMPELKDHVSPVFWQSIEIICTVVFTIEYVGRLCVCSVGGVSVCSFLKAPMNIVDLSAILPFYMSHALNGMNLVKALALMRVVRLVRLFRVFKLGRYSAGLQLMAIALKNSSQGGVVLLVFLSIGIVGFSSLMYFVEKMACPEQSELRAGAAEDGRFSSALEHYRAECRSKDRSSRYGLCCNEHEAPLDFPTIIATFWWSIVTMTTVGFGDAFPRTVGGKIVATFTMLCGILLLAMPIAIIGRKFQEAYDAREESLGRGKTTKEEPPWPSLREMGHRMQQVRVPDLPEVGRLAKELAEEFEELAQVEQEILSMRRHGRSQQKKVMRFFDSMLDRFLTLSDSKVESPSGAKKSRKKKMVTRALTGAKDAIMFKSSKSAGSLKDDSGIGMDPSHEPAPGGIDAGDEGDPATAPSTATPLHPAPPAGSECPGADLVFQDYSDVAAPAPHPAPPACLDWPDFSPNVVAAPSSGAARATASAELVASDGAAALPNGAFQARSSAELVVSDLAAAPPSGGPAALPSAACQARHSAELVVSDVAAAPSSGAPRARAGSGIVVSNVAAGPLLGGVPLPSLGSSPRVAATRTSASGGAGSSPRMGRMRSSPSAKSAAERPQEDFAAELPGAIREELTSEPQLAWERGDSSSASSLRRAPSISSRQSPQSAAASANLGRATSFTSARSVDNITDERQAEGRHTPLVAPISLTAQPPPPPPPLPPVSRQVSFDGVWDKASIDGDWVTFSTGDRVRFSRRRSQTIQISWGGDTFEGEMQTDGRLRWSDGDVWTPMPRSRVWTEPDAHAEIRRSKDLS